VFTLVGGLGHGLMILPCGGRKSLSCHWRSFPAAHASFLWKAVAMSELDRIRAKIEATEADLAEAKRANRSEAYLISIQNTLAEQQKKENLLLAQSVPAPG